MSDDRKTAETWLQECDLARQAVDKAGDLHPDWAVDAASRLLAVARNLAGTACAKCQGYGRVAGGATSRRGAGGQTMTVHYCLDCYGTGVAGFRWSERLVEENQEISRLRLELEDRDRGLVVCHEELRELGEESDRMSLSLRNVLMLSKRIRKTDPENAEHLVRFCREAGIEDSILRGDVIRGDE